jgi:hypothetical protein
MGCNSSNCNCNENEDGYYESATSTDGSCTCTDCNSTQGPPVSDSSRKIINKTDFCSRLTSLQSNINVKHSVPLELEQSLISIVIQDRKYIISDNEIHKFSFNTEQDHKRFWKSTADSKLTIDERSCLVKTIQRYANLYKFKEIYDQVLTKMEQLYLEKCHLNKVKVPANHIHFTVNDVLSLISLKVIYLSDYNPIVNQLDFNNFFILLYLHLTKLTNEYLTDIVGMCVNVLSQQYGYSYLYS